MAHWAKGWDRTRQRILARDGGVCWICKQPGATTVDHLIPRAAGGGHEDGNLAAAHLTCNSRRGAKTGVHPTKAQLLPRSNGPSLHNANE